MQALGDTLADQRVHDLLQHAQPLAVVKDHIAQQRPVEGAVGLHDVLPESANHLQIARLTRQNHIVRQLIGVDHLGAQFVQHLHERGLARGDITRHADQVHARIISLRASRIELKAVETPRWGVSTANVTIAAVCRMAC